MTIFSPEHLLVLLALSAIGCFLIFLVPRFTGIHIQFVIGELISWTLCLSILIWTFIQWRSGKFNFRLHLPLDICNLSSLLMPVLIYTQADFLYQVLFYVIIAGTLQGLITPDLDESYPHITYFKYWIVHGGLVLAILYMTIVMGFHPTYPGIWYAFGILQPYAILIFLFNQFTGANYAYLSRKPEIATLLDHFGDFPYYIFVLEGITLGSFHAIYLLIKLL